jgi:hypothetical protein
MSAPESTHGLACPNCGGMVPIPEGQVIVRCPYCEMRSIVHGERGLHRYQVPRQVDRERAEAALKQFLTSSQAIAREAARKAELIEVFTAYLPFWMSWAGVLGWVFGEKQVGSGDNRRYEPREVKVAERMTWNIAACDVGEFGVQEVPDENQTLEPFNSDRLHSTGMVFEPIGSLSEAWEASRQDFQDRVQSQANLDRVSQAFVRLSRHRMGLVYYPLWVIRYRYRGRAFQVVLDGYSGKILYGKAPGSTLYRAAVLVGGMAAGAFLAVDASALALWLGSQGDGNGSGMLFIGGLVLLVAGFGLMLAAYRKFRYGEQYEFRRQRRRGGGEKGLFDIDMMKDVYRSLGDVRSMGGFR